MKTPIVILISTILLVGSLAFSQGIGRLSLQDQQVQLSQSAEIDPAVLYTVEQGTASGDGYQLTSLTWRVSGSSSSEGYHLLELMQPTLRGSGCCCTYLPLILCDSQ